MDQIDEDGNAPGLTPEADPHEVTDYAVGKGKPPMITRFKSGRSGNPNGRPKGSKSRKTIVRAIMNELHTVTEGGRRRRRSTIELMLIALRNRMAEGDPRAIRAYMKILAKYEPQASDSKVGYMVAPAPITKEEEIAMIEKVNAEGCAKHAERCRERDLEAARRSGGHDGDGNDRSRAYRCNRESNERDCRW